MKYRKEKKYLEDMKPTILVLDNLSDEISWRNLTWYHKKKFINEYLASQNKKQIEDVRNYKFQDIVYDSSTRKILDLEITDLKKN